MSTQPPTPRSLAGDAEGTTVRHWHDPDWVAEADAWVAETFDRHGIAQTGPGATYKVRFWSVVRTYPTEAGLFWFKENNPGQAFEATLVAALADLVPDLVVSPLAIRADPGWLLTAHQGEDLYQSGLIHEQQVRLAVVRELAVLQRALAEHHERAERSGITAVLPTAAGGVVRERLARLLQLPSRHPLRPADDLADRVRRAAGELDRRAETFDPTIPATLEHNDLHGANVLASNGRLRLFDFGDAVWGHPFTTLYGFLNSLDEKTVPPDSPDRAELISAYLADWTDLADPPELRAEFDRAGVLLPVHRLVSWHRLIDHADLTEITAWIDSPRHWLGQVARIGDAAPS